MVVPGAAAAAMCGAGVGAAIDRRPSGDWREALAAGAPEELERWVMFGIDVLLVCCVVGFAYKDGMARVRLGCFV